MHRNCRRAEEKFLFPLFFPRERRRHRGSLFLALITSLSLDSPPSLSHSLLRLASRTLEEGFDYDGHYAWFARELRHEPNPRRLFQDAFNAVPVEKIPRSRALHMVQFYLTAREREAFAGGEYPADVVRKSEALLRTFERTHGLSFSPLESATSSLNPPSAVAGWLVDGAGGSQGGVPGMDSELNTNVDFIRTNRFDLTPFYKPVALQLMIAATRLYGSRQLQAAGFRRLHDEATDIVLWVRLPENRHGMHSK